MKGRISILEIQMGCLLYRSIGAMPSWLGGSQVSVLAPDFEKNWTFKNKEINKYLYQKFNKYIFLAYFHYFEK
jgi:hypothetical protein